MNEARAYLRSLALAVRQTQFFITDRRKAPDAFTILSMPAHKEAGTSSTLQIDLDAEAFLHGKLKTLCDPELLCVGEEERVADATMWAANRVAITDALDGSSFCRMGVNHWAVVAAIVDMRLRDVVAAAIADGAGRLLAAHRDLPGAYIAGTDVFQPCFSTQTTVRGCALAFNGSTPRRFLYLSGRLGERFHEVDDLLALGGHPAIVRVLHGEIDACFSESYGYDFAQAAFIAEKAGAYVCDWQGKPLDYFDALCRRRSKRHSWIVAANEALGNDLSSALRADGRP
ncbi:MAG: hypothetical protein HY437_00430 [Candidatus Magasanikbacteria bacterium]|nr:hypothetical protein [Candidatus Magasanikbacteria bacterium]